MSSSVLEVQESECWTAMGCTIAEVVDRITERTDFECEASYEYFAICDVNQRGDDSIIQNIHAFANCGYTTRQIWVKFMVGNIEERYELDLLEMLALAIEHGVRQAIV